MTEPSHSTALGLFMAERIRPRHSPSLRSGLVTWTLALSHNLPSELSCAMTLQYRGRPVQRELERESVREKKRERETDSDRERESLWIVPVANVLM